MVSMHAAERGLKPWLCMPGEHYWKPYEKLTGEVLLPPTGTVKRSVTDGNDEPARA
jgi:hypothetical protein